MAAILSGSGRAFFTVHLLPIRDHVFFSSPATRSRDRDGSVAPSSSFIFFPFGASSSPVLRPPDCMTETDRAGSEFRVRSEFVCIFIFESGVFIEVIFVCVILLSLCACNLWL
ncbi:TonB-dependent Receptor Plug Domain [Sesbania bispinosa]|nr:TonB-dependent Receptor Plug Domain [Sesbania bispinosa]